MAKQFDIKHFLVKKPCQTDLNSTKQTLGSEAAEDKSDLTESMGKYIFFLCLMVKRVVHYERWTLMNAGHLFNMSHSYHSQLFSFLSCPYLPKALILKLEICLG